MSKKRNGLKEKNTKKPKNETKNINSNQNQNNSKTKTKNKTQDKNKSKNQKNNKKNEETTKEKEIDLLIKKGKYTELKKYLKVKQPDLNESEKYHKQNLELPLVTAVKVEDLKKVKLLLKNGADPLVKTISRWTVLQESNLYKREDISLLLYYSCQLRSNQLYHEKIKTLVKLVGEIEPESFDLKIRWKISTLVPFISFFCPSDEYHVRKQGNKLRVDFTMIGFGKGWKRSKMTIILNPEISNDIVVVDNEKKEYFNLTQQMQQLQLKDVKKDFEFFRRTNNVKVIFDVEEASFVRKKSIFGKKKVNKVGLFENCKIYDLKNFQYIAIMRDIDRQKWSGAKVLKKKKKLSCKLYLSKEFPWQPTILLPFLKILIPEHHIYELVEKYVHTFPNNSFPVKVVATLFPAVYMTVEVFHLKKRKKKFKKNVFLVPKNYICLNKDIKEVNNQEKNNEEEKGEVEKKLEENVERVLEEKGEEKDKENEKMDY
ncbi:ankyrin repeat domain-containing protein 13c [Anaeramoeba flamelloides]|uniref:Ankyrin repeat domain-containing protein 13c n=1 Tax=Anaeramoeba flamelloides TaxID=1746091 RepID=A0ABQ8Z4V4_9EUKA|nr:ankyrin repeat domain-containing protein 13c [Anaeramoeba flamelloides]